MKQVVGPDDYATMKEVITRRYRKVEEEGRQFPDLIVIDGDKGQLKSALEALEELRIDTKNIDIIGLAERLEEVYIPGDSQPIILARNSETLRVLKHIRDEAHRFGITFHRSLRAKAQQVSALDGIPGIGPKRKEILLKHFGSVSRIKAAEEEEIKELVGRKSAEAIKIFFTQKEGKNIKD